MNSQKLIDNFSTHLKSVIAKSISLAAYLGHTEVEPIHLLTVLSEEDGCVGAEILKKLGITSEQIKKILASHAPMLTKQEEEKNKSDESIKKLLPELNPASRQVLEKALTLAYNHNHNYIGTEHLLYGIFQSHDKTIAEAVTSLLRIDKKMLEEQLETSFGNATRFASLDEISSLFDQIPDGQLPDGMPMSAPLSGAANSIKLGKKMQSAVALFTEDLTGQQAQQKIDPVIGRETEISRAIHILMRRNKNNPILVGEPGVGKTAIVEGLAKKISEGDVPDVLKGKKILSLDLTLLVAGTIYRGEFEARLKQIIDECSRNPNYILFIDELHNIIGAGSNQGTMDAANILKPALARGQLRCIGATTYEEYKKYISSDPALERRFQAIHVDEPGYDDTLHILEGIKPYYEKFHHVIITPEALTSALEYSTRYIHDNFQPDKAIDLIDEASAAVRTKQKTSEQDSELFALTQKVEELEQEKEQAIAQEKFKDALKIKSKLVVVRKKIDLLQKKKSTSDKKIPRSKVTQKDVAVVVSEKLHIDPVVIMKSDWERLDTLEPTLNTTIIGQTEVIHDVVHTLRRSYIQTKTNTKPIASFLFVGPSGVGKTELAKKLAKELFQDEKALIKLDMSEFAEAHSISKILGSPAGYVGYKDRNPFIDQLKKKPYSVILFDEFDKAHADVRKLLLQILDEGEISDNSGKKIHLKQSIVILTSNLGSELFTSSGIGFGTTHAKSAHEKNDLTTNVIGKLKEQIGSAILSRIGKICIFNKLTDENIKHIIELHIASISADMEASQHISITADSDAVKTIISKIETKEFGARNVQQTLENYIHELLIPIIQGKKKKKQYMFTVEKGEYKLS